MKLSAFATLFFLCLTVDAQAQAPATVAPELKLPPQAPDIAAKKFDLCD